MNYSTKVIFVSGLAIFLALFMNVFSRAYRTNAAGVIDAWLFAEANTLREGQLLPTIAKAERLIQLSDLLSGVVLFDISQSPPLRLMAIGEGFEVSPEVLAAGEGYVG